MVYDNVYSNFALSLCYEVTCYTLEKVMEEFTRSWKKPIVLLYIDKYNNTY